jgi:phage terminase small subunit
VTWHIVSAQGTRLTRHPSRAEAEWALRGLRWLAESVPNAPEAERELARNARVEEKPDGDAA